MFYSNVKFWRSSSFIWFWLYV